MKCKIFLTALLLLLGLASCGETSVPDESAAPTEPPSVTQNPMPEETPRPSGILDDRQPLEGQENLWYIPNEMLEKGTGQSVALYKDALLVWGSVNEAGVSAFRLTLLELKDGQVRGERCLEGLGMPAVQVCGDRIAVSDWGDGTILLLDDQLQTVENYQITADWNAVYLDDRGAAAYSFTRNEGIWRLNLTTGEQTRLLPEGAELYPSVKRGNWVTLTWVDRESQVTVNGAVDLHTGQVMEMPLQGAFYGVEYSEGLWLAGEMGEEHSYLLSRGGETLRTEGERLTLTDGLLRILRTVHEVDGSSALVLYDENGACLGSCSLASGLGLVLIGDPVWWEEQGGYLFTAIDPAGRDTLLFWQPTPNQEGERLMMAPLAEPQRPGGTAVSVELYQWAEELSQRYGLLVYIADQCDTEFDTYSATQELVEPLIREGLEELENALADYPEGFFDQLRFGTRRSIEIHLVGALTNLEEVESRGEGFSNFTGFVEDQGDRAVLVLDINHTGTMEQTCHHELFHLIDQKLEFDAGLRAEALYSEEGWGTLNPEGFRYAESLFELPEDFYLEPYENWFIDDYSRTYAKEDRARIMEHAMMGNEWSFDDEEGRRAKLDYLAAAIRDAFDTTGWPEETCWEDTLAQASGE